MGERSETLMFPCAINHTAPGATRGQITSSLIEVRQNAHPNTRAATVTTLIVRARAQGFWAVSEGARSEDDIVSVITSFVSDAKRRYENVRQIIAQSTRCVLCPVIGGFPPATEVACTVSTKPPPPYYSDNTLPPCSLSHIPHHQRFPAIGGGHNERAYPAVHKRLVPR